MSELCVMFTILLFCALLPIHYNLPQEKNEVDLKEMFGQESYSQPHCQISPHRLEH